VRASVASLFASPERASVASLFASPEKAPIERFGKTHPLNRLVPHSLQSLARN